ncbi:glycoside hydrolase family 73 protein [Lactobacillus rodentium]|uniref:Muramidase n=1 Tax=Lactobacillus rodentium TaxID=947835 RepID=A0A2Z6TU88_9LACO|nr:glycoside hydrolase family 73 protein [Lactobacillus rodentium]MCR1894886.1 glycoside hydrolase family 73 protein [Lactobacillus rodentium]GBG05279.1 muramidase [Lactobacillus rodentium]
MKKRTFTGMATAAALTAAGISVTNSLEKKANPSQGVVQAATTAQQTTTAQTQTQQTAQTPQQQFLNKAIPAATTASSNYGTYTSVMIAQAALESGWGQSSLAQEPNNNLFGIKGSYNGQSVNMGTTEYGSNGYYNTNSQFRKYPSYTESFNDNGALLRNGISGSNNFYSGTWVENANSGSQATQGLQGKYATDPQYAAKLNQVIQANNLTQYDPVIKKVNETRTVIQDTAITSAPVDANVGTSVGTAKKGQQLLVTEYITYGNGVSHALTNLGWVNATAFGLGKPSSQAPTNPAKPTSPQNTVDTNKYTIHPVTEVVTVAGTGNAGLKVRSTPNGNATGQVLKEGTRWKVSGYVIADDGFRYNRVGTNQWINDAYCSHLNEAPAATTKYTVTNVNDVATVTTTSVPVWNAPTEAKGTTTGQILKTASRWKVTGIATINSHRWLRVGTNQWIDSNHVTLDSQKSVANTVDKPKSTPITSSASKTSGVLTINYRDDQAVTVWNQPGGQPTGKYLTNKTSWRFFAVKEDYGATWYNLGGNQWVPAQYVYVR